MIHEFKLTIINFFILTFAFSDVETILKPIALIVSIIYTIYKIIEIHKKIKDKIDGSNNIRKDKDFTSED